MSIELLEHAVDELGPLVDDVIFVGAATLALWITDPAAPPPRPTVDVDVIVEVTTRAALADFDERLRARGFKEDQESGVICRWRHKESGSILDAMPASADLLGFENRWQREAIPHAVHRELPSDRHLRAVPPAYLLATKLEAFRGRGADDLLASKDFEDIVNLVDGREELLVEVAAADVELRAYVRSALMAIMSDPRFLDALYGSMRPDLGSQERADSVVLPRLRQLALSAGG